jgi:tRNA dimethylallyltransferase
VGKTSLLSDLFSGLGEVINADSMQVYRGMDIGTAKPTKEILQKVPHHLIDIMDPDEQFDLGYFVRTADKIVLDILGRGKIPIVSGGTAYYLKHFIYGLPSSPKSDPRIRNRLKKELETRGMEAMFQDLQRIDPLSAEKIAPSDRYRILRALEVFYLTGSPLSAFPPAASPREHINVVAIGLYREREELNKRIDRRVERMFEEGLVDEVKQLMSRGYGPETPGMRGIGYREFLLMKENGCMTLESVKECIKHHSRRYAKRQMTFFRSLPNVTWIQPDNREFFKTLPFIS